MRNSNASRRSLALTSRPLNLTGAEIYSLSLSRNPTTRGSNFNNADFYSMMGCQGFPAKHSNFGLANLYSVLSSMGPTPRSSKLEEICAPGSQALSSPSFGFYPVVPPATTYYPAPSPVLILSLCSHSCNLSCFFAMSCSILIKHRYNTLS
ncbi:hypothetical protein NE237_016822 [Protea cynaroides]|uniref:Uncharacterized protein n=1 Tax=Protea cynaroides TaxID=273540 RepID=A0A9Q0HHN5_9MAGN|nr:hypothetical protein NE237_016822 [Protea cynaroides]